MKGSNKVFGRGLVGSGRQGDRASLVTMSGLVVEQAEGFGGAGILCR